MCTVPVQEVQDAMNFDVVRKGKMRVDPNQARFCVMCNSLIVKNAIVYNEMPLQYICHDCFVIL